MSPRKENYKSKNLLENSDTHNSLNRAKSLGKEQFRKIEPLRIDPSGEKDHSKTIGLFGRIDSFGCYDFETFTLEDGLASISYDFVLRFIDKEDLVPFTREQQERWKSCLTGGIVEVLDLNLKQEAIFSDEYHEWSK